jgi:hypothetical protein
MTRVMATGFKWEGRAQKRCSVAWPILKPTYYKSVHPVTGGLPGPSWRKIHPSFSKLTLGGSGGVIEEKSKEKESNAHHHQLRSCIIFFTGGPL